MKKLLKIAGIVSFCLLFALNLYVQMNNDPNVVALQNAAAVATGGGCATGVISYHNPTLFHTEYNFLLCSTCIWVRGHDQIVANCN